MFLKKLALMFTCFTLYSTSASASLIIQSDWDGSPGDDNFLTYVEDTGLTWLNLRFTAGMSFASVYNDLLEVNSDLYGFRIANAREVDALYSAFSVPEHGMDFSYRTETLNMINMISQGGRNVTNAIMHFGDGYDPISGSRICQSTLNKTTRYVGQVTTSSQINNCYADPYKEWNGNRVFLVSGKQENVGFIGPVRHISEPFSAGLILFGMCGVLANRRTKQ